MGATGCACPGAGRGTGGSAFLGECGFGGLSGGQQWHLPLVGGGGAAAACLGLLGGIIGAEGCMLRGRSYQQSPLPPLLPDDKDARSCKTHHSFKNC